MIRQLANRALFALLLATSSGVALAQRLALSFDDGPRLNETPRLPPAERNTALLAALAKHRAHAALFVTVANGADRPEGLALARAWGEAGHLIANHTVTHPDLNRSEVTLAQYQREVLDCDAVIRELPGYRRWFRFTYLREGNTPEKRDGMRAFLREHDYRNGYVSIDTSDWRFDAYLREVLSADPNADIEPIRISYLEHLRQRTEAYRALAWRLQGREIPHVLLLHHNLVNALWLDNALAMFAADGWQFVSPDDAYADPIYALAPQRDVPGQSLLLSMARSLGLERFEGWERLVDDGEFEIERLRNARH
jgi:peptidoglycan/xylan/chitin deacetylase (PgdA/CDA1 family)